MTALTDILLSETVHDRSGQFREKLLPHLQAEYFGHTVAEQAAFNALTEAFTRYKTAPTLEQSLLELQKHSPSLPDYEQAAERIRSLYEQQPPARNFAWVKDQAEEFIRERAYHIAQQRADSAQASGQDPRPFLDDARKALDFKIDTAPVTRYNARTAFQAIQKNAITQSLRSLPQFPKIARKELGVLQAAPNVGKSATLVHIGCDYMQQGLNVLFVSNEMTEDAISKRVTVNLLQHKVNELPSLTEDQINSRLEKLGPLGSLVIRKFPRGSAHAGDFDDCIEQLAHEDGFRPDVIIVDYLNECASQKLSRHKNMTSYQYVGECAAELSNLAEKHNAILWTATQTNRNGYHAESDMKNTSASSRINEIADVMVGLSADKNLPDRLIMSVIKMRHDEKAGKFSVHADFSRMTLYDLSNPNCPEQLEPQNFKQSTRPASQAVALDPQGFKQATRPATRQANSGRKS